MAAWPEDAQTKVFYWSNNALEPRRPANAVGAGRLTSLLTWNLAKRESLEAPGL